MRLLLQSQVYFIASVLLHLALFFSLLSGLFRFDSRSNVFEATIEFKPPETKPSSVSTTGPASITKQEKSPGSDSSLLSSKSLATKQLDEILKNRRIKVRAGDDLNETIVKKKSDLLGYLRANKQTKEAANIREKPATTKDDSVKPTPTATNHPDKTAITSPEAPLKPIEQNVARAQDNTIDQTPETTQPTSAIQRIWQKKNDDQSYRRVLKKLVTANWIVPPVKVKDFQVLIEAVIDKNGNLVKIEQLEGSGLAILDAAAERAIRVSTPFPRRPASLGEEKTEFKAIFRFTPDQVVY
jgi:hypothetical protein